MLTQDEVARNVERISAQLRRFLDFTPGPAQALLVNNLDWTAPLSAIDFLRDIGKHFPINAHARQGFGDATGFRRRRAHLRRVQLPAAAGRRLTSNCFRRYGCRLQIGGSDQWGNITAGLDLIRRVTGESAHGLTVPLVTNASGEKFGKSTGGGRVWLDPGADLAVCLLPVLPQHRRRRCRSPTCGCSPICPGEEIEEMEAAVRAEARRLERPSAGSRRTSRRCCTARTRSTKVVAASEALFGRGALEELPADTLRAAVAEIPTADVSRAELDAGVTIVELAVLAGLCSSRSEARRAIDQGGAVREQRQGATTPMFNSPPISCLPAPQRCCAGGSANWPPFASAERLRPIAQTRCGYSSCGRVAAHRVCHSPKCPSGFDERDTCP